MCVAVSLRVMSEMMDAEAIYASFSNDDLLTCASETPLRAPIWADGVE
jgi:hypothetical protein